MLFSRLYSNTGSMIQTTLINLLASTAAALYTLHGILSICVWMMHEFCLWKSPLYSSDLASFLVRYAHSCVQGCWMIGNELNPKWVERARCAEILHVLKMIYGTWFLNKFILSWSQLRFLQGGSYSIMHCSVFVHCFKKTCSIFFSTRW